MLADDDELVDADEDGDGEVDDVALDDELGLDVGELDTEFDVVVDLVALGDLEAVTDPVEVLVDVGVDVYETVPVGDAVPDALTEPDLVTVGDVDPDLLDVGEADGDGDSVAADD